ncbi:MAG: hypothetical protein QXY40_00870 [Candidatus Methanomethylicia archaeon]
MGLLHVFITDRSRECKSSLTKYLTSMEYDNIFINLPRKFENIIRDAAISRDLSILVKVVDQEFKLWFRFAEPLARYLIFKTQYYQGIYCFVSDELSKKLNLLAWKTVKELLKVRIRDRVDVKSWRDIIMKHIELCRKYAEKDAEYIVSKCSDVNICLDPYYELFDYLKTNIDVNIIDLRGVGSLPLDSLLSLAREKIMKGEELDDELIEKLIRDHVKFIRDVEVYGFDNAYSMWIGRNQQPK